MSVLLLFFFLSSKVLGAGPFLVYQLAAPLMWWRIVSSKSMWRRRVTTLRLLRLALAASSFISSSKGSMTGMALSQSTELLWWGRVEGTITGETSLNPNAWSNSMVSAVVSSSKQEGTWWSNLKTGASCDWLEERVLKVPLEVDWDDMVVVVVVVGWLGWCGVASMGINRDLDLNYGVFLYS